MSRLAPWVFLGSVGLHGALFGGISGMRAPPHKSVVRVELANVPKEKPKSKPKPPPPREPEPSPLATAAAAKPAAPKPAPVAAARANAPVANGPVGAAGDAPDLGFQPGVGGPGGLAVPVGGGGAAPASAPASASAKPAARVLTAAPKPEACAGETRKAKAIRVPSPAYPESERDSATAGKVRVEISIDASGAVVAARVLQGLGPAFDAAALAAARGAAFEPALDCGRAVPAKFTVGMTFRP